jgi:hypothetical protein
MLQVKIIYGRSVFIMFVIDADISDKEEILQTINGERWYNDTIFLYDNILYKEAR